MRKNWTVEQRLAQSDRLKQQWQDPSQRARWLMGGKIGGPITAAKAAKDGFPNLRQTGRKASEEARRKMRLARARSTKKARHTMPHSVHTRAKLRETTLRQYEQGRVGRKSRDTSLELTVRAVLDVLDIEYRSSHRINRFIVDIYVPSRNLIIECDGAYWHSLPRIIGRDVERDAFLRASGYKVLRLPECDIKSGLSPDVMLSLCEAAI